MLLGRLVLAASHWTPVENLPARQQRKEIPFDAVHASHSLESAVACNPSYQMSTYQCLPPISQAQSISRLILRANFKLPKSRKAIASCRVAKGLVSFHPAAVQQGSIH